LSKDIVLDVPKILPDIKKRIVEPALDFYKNHWRDKERRFDGPIVFFDVETTGLNPDEEDIIEIGALSVKYNGDSVEVDAFWDLLNPGRSLPPKIVEITGLTDADMNASASPPAKVYQSFLNWLDDLKPKYFVAHNAVFDRNMIHKNLARYGFDNSVIPEFLCTLQLSKRHFPNLDKYKLEKVAEHCGISNQKAHRAITDAEVTAGVFFKIYEKKDS